ncbi:MAG: metal-dependent hydrolase [Planctomycetaceae bacterium]|nr:metal-dependent hydrolase [Planctomycetaceae bacterium]
MSSEDDFSRFSRRELLTASVGMASLAMISSARLQAMEDDSSEFPIIDTNVSLFRWPFRRLPLDTTAALQKKLQSLGIVQAWAGSFEGLFHRDLVGVNSRLIEECRQHKMFVPIGSVNPTLPGWEQDLQRCLAEESMLGIRLHPNYHGYTLDSPNFSRILKLATEAGRFVQLAVALEDTRTQPEQLQVPDVDLTPLPTIVKRIPQARVQLLNDRPRGSLINQLRAVPGIYFDTARVDGTDGIPNLVQSVEPGRVLFGTHSPFLIPEAALIRTHESGRFNPSALRSVLAENAERFREGNVT